MTDEGNARQQIGETLGYVRSLSEQLKEFKTENNRQEDRLTKEIAESKASHTQQQQALTARIETLSIQVQGLSERAKKITEDVDRARKEIGELKQPVDQLVAIRNRFGGIGLVIIFLGSLLWYFNPLIIKAINSIGR